MQYEYLGLASHVLLPAAFELDKASQVGVEARDVRGLDELLRLGLELESEDDHELDGSLEGNSLKLAEELCVLVPHIRMDHVEQVGQHVLLEVLSFHRPLQRGVLSQTKALLFLAFSDLPIALLTPFQV